MMHFYGLSDTQVLEMPIRRFWLLHRNIDRISAENDMKMLHTFGAAQGGEGFKEHQKTLQKRIGKVVTIESIEEITTEGEIDYSSLPNSWRDQMAFDELKFSL